MSADNYYVIKSHPFGGYAAVMGFASDDREPPVRSNFHPQFPTVSAATAWAYREYAEYGVRVDPAIAKEER